MIKIVEYKCENCFDTWDSETAIFFCPICGVNETCYNCCRSVPQYICRECFDAGRRFPEPSSEVDCPECNRAVQTVKGITVKCECGAAIQLV